MYRKRESERARDKDRDSERETALCLNRLERVELDALGALFDLDGDFVAERYIHI